MAFKPLSLVSDILPEIVSVATNNQAKKYASKLHEMNMQMTNQFEFLINRRIKPLAPQESNSDANFFSKVGNAAISAIPNPISAIGAAADIEVAQLYVQDITVPDVKIEYENINGYKAAANLVFPENTTITFLEDDKGTVIRYLTEWKRQIVIPSTDTKEPNAYVFRDDQENAKRNGVLLLKSNDDSQKYPRIIFNGLKIESIGDFQIGHSEESNLVYTVSMALDDVKIPLII